MNLNCMVLRQISSIEEKSKIKTNKKWLYLILYLFSHPFSHQNATLDMSDSIYNIDYKVT
jgi:hypothetical protein